MKQCMSRGLALVVVLLSAMPVMAASGVTFPQTPEQARIQFDAAMARADDRIQAIVDVPDDQRTYLNTIDAYDAMHAELDRGVSGVLFMAYVHPDAGMREISQQVDQEYMSWMIDLGKRQDLFDAIDSYARHGEQLDPVRERLVRRIQRDYRRAGMDMEPARREELKAVQKELAELESTFDRSISADETIVFATREELAGMPEDWIASLNQVGGLYALGMDYPTIIPILDHSPNADLRQEIWLARKRRGGRANVAVLEKILLLRDLQATLLGYDTAADYETEVRMARDAETVAMFYERLRPLVRRKAEQDHAHLLAAKRRATGDPEAQLDPWDFGYYMERLRNDTYAVDSRAVQEYLPIDRVKGGLFSITESLYGIEYRRMEEPADAPFWHEDVEWYQVVDTASGDTIGEFYLDLYPRPESNKYGHAAQWGLAPRRTNPDGSVDLPVAALVCNFTKPTAEKPSLLTHDETETFFHEFGHCLHTTLTNSDVAMFAGTAVERDFVEAPSQMFEHWVWDEDVLSTFAGHYETGEPIPPDMLAGMIAAKDLCSGMLAEGQIFLGSTDQAYHVADGGEIDTTQVGLDLYGDITMFEPVPGTWFQGSFGHLTGYQAGYYGYMWSQVYAEDMFQRFEERGMLNPEAGAYYREKVLGVGGTRDSMDMVTDYLGREPSMEPFLRSLGLETEDSAQASEQP